MNTIKYSLTALTLTVAISASAQKLPSVQTESVLAPATIKIDGKTNEWDDKFKAYNNHVEFYYTLSNDDKNLYLTVQAVEKDIVRRIMNGGISLVINKTGKKNDKDGMGITFPVFEAGNRFTPRYTGGNMVFKSISGGSIGGGGGTMSFSGGGGAPVMDVVRVTSGGPITAGSAAKPLTAEQADSLMRVNNINFNNKAKNVALKGFKDLDSLVSVYNEEGIKAAGAFDSKGVYTYEMAMPLKYIGLDAASANKFTYHMLINSVEQKGVNITNGPPGAGGETKIMSIRIDAGAQMGQDATDFWGEYTLAKK